MTEQGRGLGTALVRDALLQTASVAESVGVRALLIHAETEQAADFYAAIDPGVEPSPTDPLHVLLLIKDLSGELAVQPGPSVVVVRVRQDPPVSGRAKEVVRRVEVL